MEEQRDSLTGVYNRKFGTAKFDELIEEAKKNHKSFGVIFLDLDNLKKFNDFYGHQQGDGLICRVAAKLDETVDKNGFVIRIGGDEFLILLPAFSKRLTQKLAEELRSKIEKTTVEIDGKTINPITATLGLAVYPLHGKDQDSLIRSADEALIYGKKHKGKNCVLFDESEKVSKPKYKQKEEKRENLVVFDKSKKDSFIIKFLKVAAVIFVILLIGFLIFFFGFAPSVVEKSLNPVINKPPYNVSEKARQLHEKLLVADLHADSLLWNRDLLEKSERGQVDIPRLLEGNVALQAFTVVTKTPRNLNIERNTDESDNTFWLALVQRQPLENLSSLTKRALWQAARLHEYAAKSGGRLVVVKTKKDLTDFLERRKAEKIVGGFLGIEGAHALDGKPENVDVLFDAGFRMMSPSHFFDTEMGGSAHGVGKYGLTEKGREMIRRMEAKGMLVDLAHASPKAIDDVLAIATKPIVVSHTGVRGTCDNRRNLSDEQLKAIAKTGGVIGIGFWDTAVCGESAAAIAKAIRYAANLIGAEHVALGSDFDGAVKVPFDTSGAAQITEALLNENFTEDEIAKIMGRNVIKLLSENLPD